VVYCQRCQTALEVSLTATWAATGAQEATGVMGVPGDTVREDMAPALAGDLDQDMGRRIRVLTADSGGERGFLFPGASWKFR